MKPAQKALDKAKKKLYSHKMLSGKYKYSMQESEEKAHEYTRKLHNKEYKNMGM